jgi:hypothetical protein
VAIAGAVVLVGRDLASDKELNQMHPLREPHSTPKGRLGPLADLWVDGR